MKRTPIFCSLQPAEFLVSRGVTPVYLTAEVLGEVERTEYHCAFHENICSYSKALYEYLAKNGGGFSHIVIPTSCDAMKKLYPALLERMGGERLFVLDFPKNRTAASVDYYAGELERLDEFLCR
jgi:benzoyl-CoA reductase/2-hydroxyglutaryl-CoA dehydratase subunit BcrC/BadD/HgdB